MQLSEIRGFVEQAKRTPDSLRLDTSHNPTGDDKCHIYHLSLDRGKTILNLYGHPDTPFPLTVFAHNHLFDFTSTILLGHLRDLRHTVVEGSDYDVYPLDLSAKGAEIFLPSDRTVSLLSHERRDRLPGMTYSLPFTEVHSTAFLSPTVTWLLRGKNGPATESYVLKGEKLPPLRLINNAEADEVAAWQRIDEILQHFGL